MYNPHAVSFSPPGGNDVQASSFVGPSISHHYMPSLPNILQPAPRVMYSSLPYTPSNLGFYYDLMQNSVHAGLQTTPYMPNLPDSTVSPSTYVPMHTNTTHTTYTAHIPYVPSNPTVCLSPQATFDHFDTEHSVASGSSSTPQHANQYTPCMSSGDVPSSSVEHDTQSIGGYQSTTGAGEFSSHSAGGFSSRFALDTYELCSPP
jgi:hypothetical protein